MSVEPFQNMSNIEEAAAASPKVYSEVVFWYAVQVISTILWSFMAYIVLKYLNTKTLATQTVFDEIIKDAIYLSMLDWFLHVICIFAILFLAPLNHYVTRIFVICRHTVGITVIYQLCILILIRYLYVFYTDQMNEAHFARNLARVFVGFISIISSIFLNLENTPLYYILTKKKLGHNGHNPISFIISIGVCWIFFIFTQYKIERYNQQQPQPNLQVEEAGEENKTFCEKNSKYIYRTVKIIAFISFTSLILYILITLKLNNTTLHLKILRVISIKDLIIRNVIPMIYIAGSNNLFSFIKSESLKIVKLCKCKNNQIDPAMIELNVL